MSSPLQNIPEIILLCREEKFITAFNDALPTYWPTYQTRSPPIRITILHESLRTIPPGTKFDLIVSPANSYGRLDGAFDDAISRTFCLQNHLPYNTLTHAVQKVLYEKWRGFVPPGTCTLVPFPEEILLKLRENENENEWGCKWLGLCPTMRVPRNAQWDREIVYECVWSLMGAVEGWNRSQSRSRRLNRDPKRTESGNESRDEEEENDEKEEDGDKINRILLTPLATGVGKVSAEKWAAQFVLALKHFVDAVETPDKWSRLEWMDIDDAVEVEGTWML